MLFQILVRRGCMRLHGKLPDTFYGEQLFADAWNAATHCFTFVAILQRDSLGIKPEEQGFGR